MQQPARLLVYRIDYKSHLTWRPQWNSNPCCVPKMLNKMSVTRLAELSNLSKSYISQVKRGKRPPSGDLIMSLEEFYHNQNKRENGNINKAIILFLKSRREGISPGSIQFYKAYLSKAIPVIGLNPSARQLSRYLNSLKCSQGGKHAYYRAISVFYNWLYSCRSEFGYRAE